AAAAGAAGGHPAPRTALPAEVRGEVRAGRRHAPPPVARCVAGADGPLLARERAGAAEPHGADRLARDPGAGGDSGGPAGQALVARVPTSPVAVDIDQPFHEAKERAIEAFERAYLGALLERHDGNISEAARHAGIDRKTVHRLLKKYDMEVRLERAVAGPTSLGNGMR